MLDRNRAFPLTRETSILPRTALGDPPSPLIQCRSPPPLLHSAKLACPKWAENESIFLNQEEMGGKGSIVDGCALPRASYDMTADRQRKDGPTDVGNQCISGLNTGQQ